LVLTHAKIGYDMVQGEVLGAYGIERIEFFGEYEKMRVRLD